MADENASLEPQPEANFMLAAEVAIRKLQSQAEAAKDAAGEAKNSADRSEKSAKRWKILSVVLGFFVVLLIATACVTGYYVHQGTQNAVSLRQQSITNCQNNDKFRLAQVYTWEKNYALQAQETKATGALLQQLISALVAGDPARIKEVNTILSHSDASAQAEITTFLKYVRIADAPKNCNALYGH